MEKIYIWGLIIFAVGVAVAANTVSAIWAEQPNKIYTWWLPLIFVLSPVVFITFGLVVEKVGVSVGAATLDSALTLCTIFVGLVFFGEWASTSMYKYIGIATTIIGIALMHIDK